MNAKSIAVLPFLNMSSDPENEYFSDGITEEIINALTGIRELKVTARTSSFAFKNRQVDVRHAGNQLGVSSILEGSVRKFETGSVSQYSSSEPMMDFIPGRVNLIVN